MDKFKAYQEAQMKLMEAAMSLVDEQCGTRTNRPESHTTVMVEACKEFYSAVHDINNEMPSEVFEAHTLIKFLSK
jgi:hypothetical protein